MQALGPQMLHQPMHLGQLKFNLLPGLLVNIKTSFLIESLRVNPTSFANLSKSSSIRKCWAECSSSPSNALSQISVAFVW